MEYLSSRLNSELYWSKNLRHVIRFVYEVGKSFTHNNIKLLSLNRNNLGRTSLKKVISCGNFSLCAAEQINKKTEFKHLKKFKKDRYFHFITNFLLSILTL
ncbi:hypothetical protein BpHYR1_049053 [Brachionus plicatilis]|uniref:Uncharacterized protein n=1 Tax=Brachionus plicatilis TaxID=10195 RepID=A0A3M7SE37_BRAPC|nr:hypothetical protein BpHYR1_049053 [Brachionus plicatilis]